MSVAKADQSPAPKSNSGQSSARRPWQVHSVDLAWLERPVQSVVQMFGVDVAVSIEASEDVYPFRPTLAARRDHSPPIPLVFRQISDLTRRERNHHFKTEALRSLPKARAPKASATGQRRVIVRVHAIKSSLTSHKALLAHCRYLARDATVDGSRSEGLFDGDGVVSDGVAFAGRCREDSRHFRLMINPEDGRDIVDLEGFARDLIARVETDLGTSLDWIGSAHRDTGRPHLHLLLRGKREGGEDLLIPHDYFCHGIRGRAQEIVTERLGPRLQKELAGSEVSADRFTVLDKAILDHVEDGRLGIGALPEPSRPDILRRLVHLEARGHVSKEPSGSWRIPLGLRRDLQAIGDRHDRSAAAVKAIWGSAASGHPARLQAVDLEPGQRLVGGLVGSGPVGHNIDGPHVLVLELMDGRLGHVCLRRREPLLALDRVPEGAVVEVWSSPIAVRASDQTISEVAANNLGIYSADAHKAQRPEDRGRFIQCHVRRVGAMSRAGACEALGRERFRIADDYCDGAFAADCARHGTAASDLRVLDARPLERQIDAPGLTYLDRHFGGRELGASGASGFGSRVIKALDERTIHLRGRGLGSGDPFKLTEKDTQSLLMTEVESMFERLQAGGKPVFLADEGASFRGVYTGRVHIATAAYAVVEDAHANALVPWRPAIDAFRGQAVSGMVQEGLAHVGAARHVARGLGLEL